MKKFLTLLFFLSFALTVFQIGACGTSKHQGCDCEGLKTAKSEIYVSPSKVNNEFSTFEYTGSLEADAGCHTKMTLIFRWADGNKATTSTERPPLNYEFQSLFGWFPANQGMETTYVDYDGFHVWKIEISEAIDKSKPEGSSYGIYVEYAGDSGAEDASILCSVTIEYHIYSEDAYINGCTRSGA